ncbi:MaoC like domain-domain-containing protein [Clohesyomyces aquaticus]|uniref:MaoC like domain-domain-containing protein n=1 Tax=Clohesyomyces aquaticus TaxID=1231657 RepID=A0A1Y2A4S5_9PLEO|nr:MaoC like domain-domain-containing protein [Clohesyomyces aquaticus]
MPPTTINLPAIKQLSWSITTSYTVSQIISYNLALGAPGLQLPLTFEGHPNFHALPTYGAVHDIAVMGLVHRAMADFLPNFESHNHVHGEHFLQLKKAYPIPRGTEQVRLKTTAKVVDIVDRRSGVLVCVDIETVEEESGDVICLNEWGGFVMKIPTAGANKAQVQRGQRTTLYPTPTRAPDKVVSHNTSPEQAALYRAASGDLNALHIDPETAKAAGFPAPILAGTCTLGMGVRHVVDAFAGGDVRRFKSVKCRLSKPVFAALGDEVRTEMWKEQGGRRILYRQVVGEGSQEKVVVGMAVVELSGTAVDGKL